MRTTRTILLGSAALALSSAAAACANDPVYVDAPAGIEVGLGQMDGDNVGMATLTLPFDETKLTSMDYQRERTAALTELNARFDPDVADDQFPLVRLDQLDVEIEWHIRNLSDQPGTALIDVNGANQYFAYVPLNFAEIDPATGEAENVPPPLAGHVPIEVPALGDISGVFREDTLREAAIELELITRGLLNPFAAILNNYEDIQSTADVTYVPFPPDQDMPPAPPPPLPIEAFGHLVRVDLVFSATQHMVLEYVVRVRDADGLLHEELLGADPAELHTWSPAVYTPPALPAP